MKSVNILFLCSLFLCIYSCSSKFEKAVSYDLAEVKSKPIIDKTGQNFIERKSPNKKIIFSANISLTVSNIDTTNNKLELIAGEFGGYIVEVGTYQSIIRVKSDQLDVALDKVSSFGKITNKSISGRDVTESYLDFEIRLENAVKTRERYLQLLDKSVTVEEILKVEKELERLNQNIDLIKGQMNRINELDEFSTITIRLKKKKKPGILGYIGLGLYHSVKWLFVRD